MLCLKKYSLFTLSILLLSIMGICFFSGCTPDPGKEFVARGAQQVVLDTTDWLSAEGLLTDTAHISDAMKVDRLLYLVERLQNSDEVRAFGYARKAENLAVQHNWPLAHAISLYYLSSLKGRQEIFGEDIYSVIEDSKFSQGIFARMELHDWEIRTLTNLGDYYFKQGINDSAKSYFYAALSLLDKHKVPDSLLLRGAIMHELGNLAPPKSDTALAAYSESMKLYRQAGDESSLVRLGLDLGRFYEMKNEYEVADSLYQESLVVAIKTHDQNGEKRVYEKLGYLNMLQYYYGTELQLFQDAMTYFEKCLKLEVENQYHIHNLMGYTYGLHATRAGDAIYIDSALVYYKKAMEGAQKVGAIGTMESIGTSISRECERLEKEGRRCATILGSSYATFLDANYQAITDTIRTQLGTSSTRIRKLELSALQREAEANRKNMLLAGLVVFVIAGLIFLLLLQRQQQKKLQARMEAWRAQINPHFMSNSLNAIESLVNQDKREAASKYLIHFSRLTRRILNGSRDANTRLSEELETLKHFLALEQLRFRDKLHFTIEVAPDLSPMQLEVPAMILQPYVENAIWHGIKPKAGPGMLRIAVKKEAGHLICIIEDDGIGREQAQKLQATVVEQRKSLGMAITEQRIQTAGKVKGVRLKIEDLKDPDGKALGTRVILRLPLKKITKKGV